jgi:hypothetical protein
MKTISAMLTGILPLVFMTAQATKTERHGTLLNQRCNFLGLGCGDSVKSQPIRYELAYNEEPDSGLVLMISADEVNKAPILKKLLFNKRQISIEEDIPLPADLIQVLQLPKGIIIKENTYPVLFKNDQYKILFHSTK